MTTTIGMLLYPGLTQLDLTGPYEVLHRVPGARVELVWKTLDVVRADSGLGLSPTTTFAACPALDVLMVPGGAGQVPLMSDPEVLAFLRNKAETARWVTAVCTGSLVLGAAGLLQGYRAATHWAYMDFLPAFGAIPDGSRVVVDRNRVTGGGVTAGLDFALRLAAEIAGEPTAKTLELSLEYDPAPPYGCGHPRKAPAELVAAAKAALARSLTERGVHVEAAAKDLLSRTAPNAV